MFSWEALTDQFFFRFREETYWTITDLQGNYVTGGYDYNSYTHYNEHRCIADGSCYVFTLYDTYGDGFSEENPFAGFDLTVDGSNVLHGGPDDFGYSIDTQFGYCNNPFPNGICPCVPVVLELHTVDGAEDVEISLTDEQTGQLIWYAQDFQDFQYYYYSACLDPSTCATFKVENGRADPGDMTLYYGGNVIYQNAVGASLPGGSSSDYDTVVTVGNYMNC